ncbi:MAG TPA: hypothetical protein VE569_14255 [Acidimicrobiia bacterium]|nr:hypothetical protein [Acidimicrobiia bacterium]
MDSAIVFTFTRPAPGREAKAFDAFTEAQTFFGAFTSGNQCEVINVMSPSGTGYLIVPGKFEDLTELIRTDEFLELYTKTVFAVPDVSYEIGAYGEGVAEWMARWARIGGELALL